ncbi:hypothetical protein K502DRAFT_347491 [Neoconidiobolus thromboides FSU 785]|nr:hypothetical protein K502DRAFT_347491 [Neoconidiobolus thromboides FSU 785]
MEKVKSKKHPQMGKSRIDIDGRAGIKDNFNLNISAAVSVRDSIGVIVRIIYGLEYIPGICLIILSNF